MKWNFSFWEENVANNIECVCDNTVANLSRAAISNHNAFPAAQSYAIPDTNVYIEHLYTSYSTNAYLNINVTFKISFIWKNRWGKIANGFSWLATILSGKIYPKEMEFCDNYHDFPMKFLVFWLISANNFDQE